MRLMSVNWPQRVTSQFLGVPSISTINSYTNPSFSRYFSLRCCLQMSAVCFCRFLVPNPIGLKTFGQVIGLFSNNAGPFSSNVVLSSPSFSIYLVRKSGMFFGLERLVRYRVRVRGNSPRKDMVISLEENLGPSDPSYFALKSPSPSDCTPSIL
jgi:hypothetical protein